MRRLLPRPIGRPCIAHALVLFALAAAARPLPAAAAAEEYLAVGDPLEAELRVLELFAAAPGARRLRHPHLGTLPVQRLELQGMGDAAAPADPVRAIAFARLERALERDAVEGRAPGPWRSTPRLLAWAGESRERLELSAAIEGRLDVDDARAEPRSGSGLQLRGGARVGRWLGFAHVLVGEVDEARTFADPVVQGTDVIAHTEDSYLAYTGEGGAWGARLGRSRWHFGPGAEGSLALSRTAPAMTGLAMRARIEGLGLDVIALSATLEQAAGEQLAAHRIEWHALDGLRLGLTETARYRAPGWTPLYAVGLVPYVLVQRLLHQDERDSLDAHRNNVMIGFDASWRFAPGARLYGEWLVDDLRAKTSANPNKYGWQVGWEGAAALGAGRVTWGGEVTRLSRHLYTSAFGRVHGSQGRPLGFPTGPDARRVRVRAAWDPSADWQVFATAARTDRGENDLDEPFVPGSPRIEPGELEGVVERERELELGVRWWPASGVDLAIAAGWRRVDDADHVPGARTDGARASAIVRLVR